MTLPAQALAHEGAWRRILFERTQNAVFVVDDQGRLLEANAAFAQLLGCTTDDALRLKLWDWDVDFPEPRAREVLARSEPAFADFESHWRRADGQLRLVVTQIHRIQQGSGWLVFGSSRDITDQRANDLALRSSEQRLGLALAAAGMGVWDWDIGTRALVLSPEAWKVLGHQPTGGADMALSLDQMRERMHADDRATVTEAVRRSLIEQVPLALECRFVRDDGSLLWLACTGLIQRDERGSARRLIGTLQDITARKTADAALRASESRLALALTASHMGVWEWTLEEPELRCRREVFEILDLDPPSPDGGPLHIARLADIVHPDDLPGLMSATADAVATQGEFVVEMRITDRQGATRWLEDRARLERGADGQPQRLVGAIRDITAQRQSQSLIAREAVRRRELMEQSRDGVMVLDLAGMVQEANPAMAAMLALPMDRLIGACASDLGAAFPMDTARSALATQAGSRVGFEATVAHAHGSAIDLEVSVSAVQVEDQRLLYAVCRDITQRKQAETALRESERRLSVALAASDMGTWVWDLTQEQVHWSAGCARILGRDPADTRDVVGSTAEMLRYLHRDDHAALLAARHEAVHGSGVFAGDFRIIGYDGKLRWARERGLIERAADGRPLRIVGALLDITEQQRTQQRLRDDATRRRVMIEQSRDGVVVLNTDGSVDEANEAFAALLGYTLDEVLGLHVWDWDAESDRETLLSILNTRQRSTSSRIIRMRRKDGQLIAADVSSNRVQLAGRQVHFCVCRDMTQRQAAQDALRASEARYRATFENSAVGIGEHTLDGRWLSANPRLCEITGYPHDELMALDYRLLSLPGELSGDWAQLRALLTDGVTSVRVEKRYRRRDGSFIWVARSSSLVRDAAGVPQHFVSIVEDITERKRIEAELAGHRQQLETQVASRTRELQAAMQARQAGEHFLRSIADNIPDMVAYWDARRILRFANRPYRDWFGRGAEVVGSSRSELVGDPADDAGELAFAAALAGRAQHFEYTLIDPQGQQRMAWLHYVPDIQGEVVVGLFALISDISEIKQAEHHLQALNAQLITARDRAEAANRAKSAFLANISHEIRTPMNAIIGLTHLMRRDLSDDIARERLGKVSDAAHHLLDVINDVLDLSKIESGKLQLVLADFPVDAVMTRTCALVAERARGKGLALQVGSAGVPTLLRGDPTRLSQALLNLVSNAVKFTDHGSIELRCDVVASDVDAMTLRFSVRDTGVGVPADKMDNLFNAFEQADTSTTRRFGGTGLGLAITRRLAQMMGGEVGAQSTLGQGSCFWFTARFDRSSVAVPPDNAWPAVQADLSRIGGRAHEQILRERHAGARVLVAEDNPVNQEVACELLTNAGLLVDLASDGQQALQLAKDTAYDLVLMDMQMPVLDGLAATRALRGTSLHARTPILAMTANAFGDDRQACLDAGMDDHLPKPVDPELLYAMLGRWLPDRRSGGAVAAARPAAADAMPAAVAAVVEAPAPDLSGIPGLAMTRALLYLPGRDQVFARVLRQFASHYRPGVPGLEAAVAAGHWVEAQQTLHALRGACGAVGAGALVEQAQALENKLEALADGVAAPDESIGLLQGTVDLLAALQALVAAIAERLHPAGVPVAVAGGVLPGPPPGAEATAWDAATEAALDGLAAMLEAADFQSGARHREIEPLLRQTFGDGGARSIERELRRHDYDAALAALQALRRQRIAPAALPDLQPDPPAVHPDDQPQVQ